MERVSTDTKGGKEGFTLVEAMVAVLILGIGLGASLLTYNMAMRSVATNSDLMSAMHAARAQSELLRTFQWNQAELAPGTYSFTNGTHVGTYTITATGNINVRDLLVRANWRSTMSDQNQQATLTTSLAKPLR